MRRLASITILILAAGASRAESDCALGAQLLQRARERAAAAEYTAAAELSQRSADACPGYAAYELLAEALARSSQRRDRTLAADAFVSAHQSATNDKERAQTLYQYAKLLSSDGDPQNALPLIQAAKTLQPDDAAITSLAERIQRRTQEPTQEQLRRGLWDSMYKPLRVASVQQPSGSLKATNGPAPPAVTSPALAPATSKPSINIPINFETGSTMVNPQTQSHVADLAKVLSEAPDPKQRFSLIGHADIRGDEAMNRVLSKRRAEAIYQSVVILAPALRNRMETEGRGSSEPLDPARTEEAYRLNRRLQVIVH